MSRFLKSKKNQSQLISVFIIFVFFAVGIFLLKQNDSSINLNNSKFQNENAFDDSSPTIVLDDFERNSIENNNILWELTGKSAEYFSDSDKVKISLPNLKYYKNQATPMTLTADSSVVSFEESNIKSATLNNNVKINNTDYTLETNIATFYQSKDLLIAPKDIFIVSEKITTKGSNLNANTLTEELHIKENVESLINNISLKKSEDTSQKQIKIISNELLTNNKLGEFKYTGNVIAEQEDIKITSDVLTGRLVNKKGKEEASLEELKATGNVTITQGKDIKATAEYADFDLEKNIIILTGNPIVEKSDSIVSADIINHFLDEEKSVAEGNVEVSMKEAN